MKNERPKPLPGGHLDRQTKLLLEDVGNTVKKEWLKPSEFKKLTEELGATEDEHGWLNVPKYNLNLYPVEKVPRTHNATKGQGKIPRAPDADNERKF